ncbi:hypothetical protein G6011_09492 [Alternaria panax]|uniref:Uncharacterized protein n=1 Tax=Alternaria panax TaxID=48097 RepID=A0AAD4IB31_9PLEO|nr:hypothetical protein G6011_09492 [Alternaria panax]
MASLELPTLSIPYNTQDSDVTILNTTAFDRLYWSILDPSNPPHILVANANEAVPPTARPPFTTHPIALEPATTINAHTLPHHSRISQRIRKPMERRLRVTGRRRRMSRGLLELVVGERLGKSRSAARVTRISTEIKSQMLQVKRLDKKAKRFRSTSPTHAGPHAERRLEWGPSSPPEGGPADKSSKDWRDRPNVLEEARLGSVLLRAWKGEYESAEQVAEDVRNIAEEVGIKVVSSAMQADDDWMKLILANLGRMFSRGMNNRKRSGELERSGSSGRLRMWTCLLQSGKLQQDNSSLS